MIRLAASIGSDGLDKPSVLSSYIIGGRSASKNGKAATPAIASTSQGKIRLGSTQLNNSPIAIG